MDRRRAGLAAVVAAALLLVVLATNVLGEWRLTPRFNLPFLPAEGTPPPYTPPPIPTPARGSGLPVAGQPVGSPVDWTAVLKVIIGLVVLAVLIFLAGLLWRTRHAPETELADATQVSVHEVVRDAVQNARDYLSRYADAGDVARAITGAWAALEDAAADSGHRRRPEHTPSEFTADLLTSVSGADAEIAELLGLYHRARYGNAAVVEALTRADADRAATLLAEVAARLDGRLDERPDERARPAPGTTRMTQDREHDR